MRMRIAYFPIRISVSYTHLDVYKRQDTANLNGNQVVIADTDGSEDGREDDRSDHPHEDSGFTQERAHVFHLEIRDDGSRLACPNFTHS